MALHYIKYWNWYVLLRCIEIEIYNWGVLRGSYNRDGALRIHFIVHLQENTKEFGYRIIVKNNFFLVGGGMDFEIYEQYMINVKCVFSCGKHF